VGWGGGAHGHEAVNIVLGDGVGGRTP
jgi:hypothetical protein